MGRNDGILGTDSNTIVRYLFGLLLSVCVVAGSFLWAHVQRDNQHANSRIDSTNGDVATLDREQRETSTRVTRVEDAVSHIRNDINRLANDSAKQTQKLDDLIQMQMGNMRRREDPAPR